MLKAGLLGCDILLLVPRTWDGPHVPSEPVIWSMKFMKCAEGGGSENQIRFTKTYSATAMSQSTSRTCIDLSGLLLRNLI